MTENEAIKIINDKYETFFALSTTNDFDMAMATSIKALEEIQQYRAIGTVEEFKALKEKNEPKKVADGLSFFKCPSCGSGEIEEFYETGGSSEHKYCPDCGQALDWE